MYNMDYSDGRESDITKNIPRPARKSMESRSSLPSLLATPDFADATTVHGPLLTNTKVYIIGDQLQIQGLKTLAKKKYEEVISDRRWNSTSFVASLKLLYEETMGNDRLLKDVAIKTAQEHITEFCDRGDFASLCMETGEVPFDILKASLVKNGATSIAGPPVRTCPSCSQSTHVSYNPTVFGTYQCSSCLRCFS